MRTYLTSIVLLCFLLPSCTTPEPVKTTSKDKVRRTRLPIRKSADERLQDESFSKYQEVFLKVSRAEKVSAIKELRVTEKMKQWLLRHAIPSRGGKDLIFLGYLETQMRGFYVDRKYIYYVYDQAFDESVGFFFENGKTYRYYRDIEEKYRQEYLGTHIPSQSIKKILRVKGEIVVKPLRTFEKYKQDRS